jgi:hypothetical protein
MKLIIFASLQFFLFCAHSLAGGVDCGLARDPVKKVEFRKWIISQKSIIDQCSVNALPNEKFSLVNNAINGDLDNFKLLFNKGISPTGKDSKDGEYYLFWAGMSSSDDLLLFLLQKSDPAKLSKIIRMRSKSNNMTLMEYALGNGYSNSVNFLAKSGASQCEHLYQGKEVTLNFGSNSWGAINYPAVVTGISAQKNMASAKITRSGARYGEHHEVNCADLK